MLIEAYELCAFAPIRIMSVCSRSHMHAYRLTLKLNLTLKLDF